VEALWKKGYNPQEFLSTHDELRAVVDWVGSNYFTPDEPAGVFNMLRDNLIHHDPFLCLPDFRSYSDAQQRVDAAFRDKARWAEMAILNTARMGKFSSDRTIAEYAREIWQLDPVKI
jgi:starch phosphorylase